ncbi:ribonuclease H-like domain-containing protein [Nemania serpens]|nr:ribonuclease H-like domain-containing protein [Nemania serpens]
MRLLKWMMINPPAGMRITKRLSFRALNTFIYRGARVTYTTSASPSPTTNQTSPPESHMEAVEIPPLLKEDREKVRGIIDTREAVSSMIDELSELPSEPPSIYMDLEGINLCRHGTVSLLQVHSRPMGQNYLVDITTLGRAAFKAKGKRSRITLRSILESEDIPKVFFDVRCDSDALYHHFQIRLQNIHDIQLMELVTRRYRRTKVAGLRQCIEADMSLKKTEKLKWKAAKEAGSSLFAPEKGGDYAVFDQRPLREEIMTYCAQDVRYLPRLWDLYHGKLQNRWRVKLLKATLARVKESQGANYEPKGPHMLLAPAGWR